MKIELKKHLCIVTKEPGDQGYDLIKKRMWKDGHLVYLKPTIQEWLSWAGGSGKIHDAVVQFIQNKEAL